MHSKIIDRIKREPTEWEKIFANHICFRGLISKSCKELVQINNNNNNKNNST